MKLYLTLILSLSTLTLFGQKVVSEKSITSTYSKKTYSLGDTVMIGAPAYGRSFASIYYYNEDRDQYEVLSGEGNQRKTGLITGIAKLQNHRFHNFAYKTIIQLEDENGKSFFFKHEESEKLGEIVIYKTPFKPDGYKDFDTRADCIYKLKTNEIKGEEAMLQYLEVTDKPKYNRWKTNEFDFNREKKDAQLKFDSLYAEYNIGDTLIFSLEGEIGTYDFEKNAFPVVKSFFGYSEKISNPFLGEFLFVNFDEFSMIPAPNDRAEFIVNTTNQTYNKTRKVYFTLKVILKDVEYFPSEVITGMFSGTTKEYYQYSMKILEMSVTNNKALYYNYIGGK